MRIFILFFLFQVRAATLLAATPLPGPIRSGPATATSQPLPLVISPARLPAIISYPLPANLVNPACRPRAISHPAAESGAAVALSISG